MGEKIVVGPINKGLRNDRTAFVIDNDSFPSLINAYQWRGRVKRKRGTSLLNRLTRYFNSTSSSYNSGSTTITLDASGVGNILSGFSLETNANIVPGSVTITAPGPSTFTDPSKNGTLSPSGTINYSTGRVVIAAKANQNISVTFLYYPDLPVMGLKDFSLFSSQFPIEMGFDTKYSYTITTNSPYSIYDVSFYKNPPATAAYIGYVQKGTVTPTSWNGQDYQQFWTVNYEGALWATNGVPNPFVTTNIGMQYKTISAMAAIVGGPPSTVNLTIAGHGLVVGDFVFINEVVGTISSTINFQTGYITAVIDVNNVTVEFPNANLVGAYSSGGIAQYLTSRSDTAKDCLRWYDGDPTNGNVTTPVLSGNNGWVNFCPPISSASFSIGNLPPAQYYLVGARMIVPFKDRLLFIGPVVQTSAAGSQVYLKDTIIYSQNGTPYYTASFVGLPSLATTTFNPILVPQNQIASASAYFSDQTGFGGFVTAGIDEAIVTSSSNEDVLVLGFEKTTQAKLVYTGNDIIPFNFFTISSEIGSGSTFSAVNMDKGVLTRGDRGFIITSQTQSERFDLEIPDQVFEINLQNNGAERFSSQRDFINEWVYFSYPSNTVSYKYPNQTLQYNYRDNSWAIFNECYTTYGIFRRVTGETWATIGNIFPTWAEWTEPWNAGSSTLLQQQVIAGNQQGFVVFRDDGTGESNSLTIKNISYPVAITGATNANPCVLTITPGDNVFVVGQRVKISGVNGMTQLNGNTYTISAVSSTTITIAVNSLAFGVYTSGGTATPPTIYSPAHGLNAGDYIVVSGCLGTVASSVNGKIYSVSNPSTDDFFLDADTIPSSGTYLGGGLIKRMYVPFIQTKQFPTAWGMSRKTRLGVQQYLLTKTSNSQVQLLIYLSENGNDAFNDSPIVPDVDSTNNSLVYSTVLYTCPESTNLGLTPANINLNSVTASTQQQIWHRINTSLIGDTVQVAITMSDAQMRDVNFTNQFSEIELHAIILDVIPSMVLA